MSFNHRDYPPHWRQVVADVRARAGDRCECEGECGLHGGRRCEEAHKQPAKWARGKVVLTTAHLNAPGGVCQCAPLCAEPDHLKSMCQRCHLRYDRELHAASARQKRADQDAAAGVLVLFGGAR